MFRSFPVILKEINICRQIELYFLAVSNCALNRNAGMLSAGADWSRFIAGCWSSKINVFLILHE